MPALMMPMPKKIRPSPISRLPYWRTRSLFPLKMHAKPIATSSSAYLVTLNATICAVTVVPISAPRITPTACDSDISPAETKPTSITVVTEEDWITAVTSVPVISPITRLVVSRARMVFMPSPATDFSAAAICSMP